MTTACKNTTLGFGFPFLFGLDAAAEFKVDYDGAAAVRRIGGSVLQPESWL